MNSLSIALSVFACVFGSALAGLLVSSRLPRHHLKEDSKDIVKLAIGVIATMAALVLGLLVSSAKGSFDRMDDGITRLGAKLIQLDRTLVHYGPEAGELRVLLKQNAVATVDMMFSGDRTQVAQLDSPQTMVRTEALQTRLRGLTPGNDAQRALQMQAVAIADELSAARWLLTLQNEGSISMTLLVVVVSWLALIFTGFGLFAPRNGTVIVALFMCALSVSAAIFLILEMESPLTGMVRISDVPMRDAVAHLGR